MRAGVRIAAGSAAAAAGERWPSATRGGGAKRGRSVVLLVRIIVMG